MPPIVDGAEQDVSQCSFGEWVPMKVDDNDNPTKWIRRCASCTNTEMVEDNPNNPVQFAEPVNPGDSSDDDSGAHAEDSSYTQPVSQSL